MVMGAFIPYPKGKFSDNRLNLVMSLNGDAVLVLWMAQLYSVEDVLCRTHEIARVYAGAFLLATYLGFMKEVTLKN